jgi:hypothetical protein
MAATIEMAAIIVIWLMRNERSPDPENRAINRHKEEISLWLRNM